MCINILTITTKTTTCPRGEIGRHKGLKILARKGVPVRVWPRAPSKNMKLYFDFDKTHKAQKEKKKFLRIYKNFSPKVADVIVVAGGDGYMLKKIRQLHNFKKPFYGLNCGTFGFLMNKIRKESLTKIIKDSKKITINPLKLSSLDKNKKKRSLIAINEVSLFRQTKQTVNLKVKIGKKILLKKLVGDGILVSTPAGSTAYNMSIYGPILSLNSNLLAVTPISPFRPRRWKGKIISNKSSIHFTNLDYKKRPVSAVADNIELRNIKSIKIQSDRNTKINVLFDKKTSLIKKNKLEKLKKSLS